MRALQFGRQPRQQRGAVAILVAVAIFVLAGLMGIVIDLGNLFVRKTELQNAADAAALSGARFIDGTVAGIDAAVAGAAEAAGQNASDFGKTVVAISDAQISFGPSPDGPWSDVAAAKGNPGNARFIRVDTTGIAQGTRPTWFMPLVDTAIGSATATGVAVGGAPVCDGAPLFICAPAGGFKPGAQYFFADQPGAPVGPGNIGYFDPVPPGSPSLINGANDMRDIICAGRVACLGVGTYSSLTQSAFGAMASAFNTRFDDFNGLPSKLTPEVCRPDTNIRQYPYTDLTPASKPRAWMTPPPDAQSEQDPGATLGVHWAAVPPTGAALAGVAAVPNGKYPSSGTPYSQPLGSIFHLPPSAAHRAAAQSGRRILTIALGGPTACDGSVNGSGKPVPIIGFGRFLLVRKAIGTGSPKGIYVEYIETIQRLKPNPPDLKLYR